MDNLHLYIYYRSGAAQRVRMGLAGILYDRVPVHLVRNSGEHLPAAFEVRIPQRRVPALELSDDSTKTVTQENVV